MANPFKLYISTCQLIVSVAPKLIIYIYMLQISFSFITFPALLAAYTGQAAYLRKFPGQVADTFYDSIPGKVD